MEDFNVILFLKLFNLDFINFKRFDDTLQALYENDLFIKFLMSYDPKKVNFELLKIDNNELGINYDSPIVLYIISLRCLVKDADSNVISKMFLNVINHNFDRLNLYDTFKDYANFCDNSKIIDKIGSKPAKTFFSDLYERYEKDDSVLPIYIICLLVYFEIKPTLLVPEIIIGKFNQFQKIVDDNKGVNKKSVFFEKINKNINIDAKSYLYVFVYEGSFFFNLYDKMKARLYDFVGKDREVTVIEYGDLKTKVKNSELGDGKIKEVKEIQLIIHEFQIEVNEESSKLEYLDEDEDNDEISEIGEKIEKLQTEMKEKQESIKKNPNLLSIVNFDDTLDLIVEIIGKDFVYSYKNNKINDENPLINSESKTLVFNNPNIYLSYDSKFEKKTKKSKKEEKNAYRDASILSVQHKNIEFMISNDFAKTMNSCMLAREELYPGQLFYYDILGDLHWKPGERNIDKEHIFAYEVQRVFMFKYLTTPNDNARKIIMSMLNIFHSNYSQIYATDTTNRAVGDLDRHEIELKNYKDLLKYLIILKYEYEDKKTTLSEQEKKLKDEVDTIVGLFQEIKINLNDLHIVTTKMAIDNFSKNFRIAKRKRRLKELATESFNIIKDFGLLILQTQNEITEETFVNNFKFTSQKDIKNQITKIFKIHDDSLLIPLIELKGNNQSQKDKYTSYFGKFTFKVYNDLKDIFQKEEYETLKADILSLSTSNTIEHLDNLSTIISSLNPNKNSNVKIIIKKIYELIEILSKNEAESKEIQQDISFDSASFLEPSIDEVLPLTLNKYSSKVGENTLPWSYFYLEEPESILDVEDDKKVEEFHRKIYKNTNSKKNLTGRDDMKKLFSRKINKKGEYNIFTDTGILKDVIQKVGGRSPISTPQYIEDKTDIQNNFDNIIKNNDVKANLYSKFNNMDLPESNTESKQIKTNIQRIIQVNSFDKYQDYFSYLYRNHYIDDLFTFIEKKLIQQINSNYSKLKIQNLVYFYRHPITCINSIFGFDVGKNQLHQNVDFFILKSHFMTLQFSKVNKNKLQTLGRDFYIDQESLKEDIQEDLEYLFETEFLSECDTENNQMDDYAGILRNGKRGIIGKGEFNFYERVDEIYDKELKEAIKLVMRLFDFKELYKYQNIIQNCYLFFQIEKEIMKNNFKYAFNYSFPNAGDYDNLLSLSREEMDRIGKFFVNNEHVDDDMLLQKIDGFLNSENTFEDVKIQFHNDLKLDELFPELKEIKQSRVNKKQVPTQNSLYMDDLKEFQKYESPIQNSSMPSMVPVYGGLPKRKKPIVLKKNIMSK